MRIAIINERWTAGATRCARDLQRAFDRTHTVRYFPEGPKLTAVEQLHLLRGFGPDVVHLHSFYGDLPYGFLAEVAQMYPIVMTLHDPRPIGDIMLKCWSCDKFITCFRCPLVGRLKRYTLFRHEYYLRRLEKRRTHRRLPRTTTFVCPSDWMRQRLMKTELARFHVERIFNGIDLNVYRRDESARAALGIAEEAKVLAFVAHHSGWTADERKGGHVLARALAEVVIPRFPNVVVLAVGGGMIPNLQNVRPIGFVDPEKLGRYYSAADVFVAPSLGDNLPYTVLEAMGCEVPVAASRVGGIPEEVEDHVTGRLFSPGSWEELGNVLLAMLGDRRRSAEMGMAGRKRAEVEFDMGAFVRNYELIYESAMAGARGQASVLDIGKGSKAG